MVVAGYVLYERRTGKTRVIAITTYQLVGECLHGPDTVPSQRCRKPSHQSPRGRVQQGDDGVYKQVFVY